MRKVPLSDGSGRWFDLDAAKVWKEGYDPQEEARRRADGPQEESLYLTPGGSFVLNRWHWSTDDRYHPVDFEQAARWLIANGYQADLVKLEMVPEERALEL